MGMHGKYSKIISFTYLYVIHVLCVDCLSMSRPGKLWQQYQKVVIQGGCCSQGN